MIRRRAIGATDQPDPRDGGVQSVDRALCICHRLPERLLDEAVLAGFEHPHRKLGVRRHGRREHDRVNRRIVEHVGDVGLFVQRCADMVKPGGLMIAATLNRTLKSFALAIVGAEYVLRWLPRGTHQWQRFVTPDELEIAFEKAGLRVAGTAGVVYRVLADRWQLSSDTDVNYMMTAEKAG